MNRDFDFNDLYVFDMANNHQGQVDHGQRIIREVAKVAHNHGVRAAMKLQMRQLDTFIHPLHQQDTTHKQIPRFLSTRIDKSGFRALVEETRQQELITMCTPFDEESVDVIEELGIEIVKIGSCSAADWPLLERVAECDKPVVFSTGGLTLKQIDDLVSFFEHRRVHFAMMHCVSIYPTPDHLLQLNQIDTLRNRYPQTPIGFSTHEDPNELTPVQIAVAKGAQVLERHVGVETEQIKLNAYSSTPEQLDRWIQAAQKARTICGSCERLPAPPEEQAALDALKRGVYARRPVKAGSPLSRGDVYFAMPYEEGQLSSGDWREGISATAALAKDAAILRCDVEIPYDADKHVLFTSIHTIKALLNEARVALNTDFEVEFSHHAGLSRFPEVGATFINCINRGYCKKLVIQMPGQRHPSHYHKRKEETFQVLHGVLELEVDGRHRTLHPGETQLIQQGVWHHFWTDTGAIFEEISSTDFNNDSFYEDKAINRLDRSQRKTVVNHWGRYQI